MTGNNDGVGKVTGNEGSVIRWSWENKVGEAGEFTKNKGKVGEKRKNQGSVIR